MLVIIKKQPWDIWYSEEKVDYTFESNDVLVLADLCLDKTRDGYITNILKELASQYLVPGFQFPDNLFNNNYFIIIISKKQNRVSLYRDASGVKSGYYHIDRQGRIIIGTNCHSVAKSGGVTEFNAEAVHMLLYLEYIFDGMTIYNEVHEVKMGQRLTFNRDLSVIEDIQEKINVFPEENNLSIEENKKLLREKIISVHQNCMGQDNIVLLSGGIDSCVMLAALHEVAEKNSIYAISYRVKGTGQDETVYAQKAAAYLGIENTIIDVNPNNPDLCKNFEDKVMQMNNPYIGMWIFTDYGANENQIVFAGQDTRLHTPDIIPLDKFVFLLKHRPLRDFAKIINLLLWPQQKSFYFFQLYKSKNRYIRNFDRILYSFNFEEYMLKYFFKINRDKIKSERISDYYFDKIKNKFKIEYAAIRNNRDLYNTIVSIKWQEQYTDDIRYMLDLGKLNGTFMAMPFYDQQLAEFSASIPFKQATKYFIGKGQYSDKKSLLNKYLLREAFKDKLADDVYYRQKSVSITNYLLYNGTLGKEIKKIISSDLHSASSFIKEYDLEKYVARFLINNDWSLSDQYYLLKLYYIAMLCIYKRKLNSTQ